MAEFDLIEIIKQRCSRARADVGLGIGDDAAVVIVPVDHDLVVCTDTMVAGVHFPLDTDPADIGWKSLAVNLSDLAAMGAQPAWATLALTLPAADTEFVASFAGGFAALAAEYDVDLIGGDTTRGPLTITVTAHGLVPSGCALRRAGAQVGDAVFVTGTLGDAAGGLRCLQDQSAGSENASTQLRFHGASSRQTPGSSDVSIFPESLDHGVSRDDVSIETFGEYAESRITREPSRDEKKLSPNRSLDGGDLLPGRRTQEDSINAGMDTSPADDVLIVRLNRPQPRVAAGIALRGLASACIDISDGLLADLGHIASASGIGFEIGEDCLPATNALFDRFDAETCRQFQLSGGDDYELAFTIAEADVDKMRDAIAGAQCRVSRIGRVIGEAGVHVLDRNGARRNAIEKGWEHFK